MSFSIQGKADDGFVNVKFFDPCYGPMRARVTEANVFAMTGRRQVYVGEVFPTTEEDEQVLLANARG